MSPLSPHLSSLSFLPYLSLSLYTFVCVCVCVHVDQSLDQLTRYYMCGHPMLLCQLDIHDVPHNQLHGHIITLVEKNTFQQQVGIYSLQTISRDEKVTRTRSKNMCIPRCVRLPYLPSEFPWLRDMQEEL